MGRHDVWQVIIFDRVLLLAVGTVFFLKALSFRRESALGVALAWNSLILGVLFTTAVIGNYVPFFMSDPFRWFLRTWLLAASLYTYYQLTRRLGWPRVALAVTVLVVVIAAVAFMVLEGVITWPVSLSPEG